MSGFSSAVGRMRLQKTEGAENADKAAKKCAGSTLNERQGTGDEKKGGNEVGGRKEEGG